MVGFVREGREIGKGGESWGEEAGPSGYFRGGRGVHWLSYCILEQCVGNAQFCGGRSGIFQ